MAFPADVTQAHLTRFVEVFDTDSSGYIEKSEWVDLVKYIAVMAWLDERNAQAAVPPPSPQKEERPEESEPEEGEDGGEPAAPPPPPGI